MLWNASIRLRNIYFKSFYMNFASVEPKYRQNGISKNLFLDTINKAKLECVDILVMDPFNHGFYTKYGYSSALENYALEIPSSLFSRDEHVAIDEIYSFSLLNNQDGFKSFQSLKEYFWNEEITMNELQVDTIFLSSRTCLEYRCAMIHNDVDKGYILYHIKDSVLTVHEIRYNNKMTLYKLKQYLHNYIAQIKLYVFENIPFRFPKEMFIKDYWDINSRIKFTYEPFRMIRIVDLYSVITKIKVNSPQNEINLKIVDESIEANTGIYTFQEDGAIYKNKYNKYDAEIGIKDFTKLLSGIETANDLWLNNKIITDNLHVLSLLDQIFPRIETFSADIY